VTEALMNDAKKSPLLMDVKYFGGKNILNISVWLHNLCIITKAFNKEKLCKYFK